ncbi:MAG: hypothetical protein IJ026_03660, partial [Candidatus Methanomethylophilaceae archaeon]|nr:hypothetical protein [Candidatus Methanomethylophilaceae archaeon]
MFGIRMKGKRGLLAVVMALAMVLAATPFVVGEADAEGEATPLNTVYVDGGYTGADSDGTESKPYDELTTAVDLVAAEGKVVLKSDYSMTDVLKIDKDLTIDLGGKTLAIEVVGSETDEAALDAKTKIIEIKNGTLVVDFDGSAYAKKQDSDTSITNIDDKVNYAIWAGELTLDKVNATITNNASSDGVDSNIGVGQKYCGGIRAKTTIQNGSYVDVYGANRGIYAELTVTNSTVNAGGYERGITTSKEILISGSTVNAFVIPNGSANGAGEDDNFGIKAYAIQIDKDSVVNTEGMHITGTPPGGYVASEKTVGSSIEGIVNIKYDSQSGKIDNGAVVIPSGILIGTATKGETATTYATASIELVKTGTVVGTINVDAGNAIIGKFTNSTGNEVEIYDYVAGSDEVSISAGSVVLTGPLTAKDAEKKITGNGQVTLKDFELVSGVLEFSGSATVTIEGEVRVSSGAKIDFTYATPTVSVDSELNIYGEAVTNDNGMIVNGEVTAYSGAKIDFLKFNSASTGTVDISAASKEFTIGGGEYISQNVSYAQNQIVTVTGDLYLQKESVMTILGEMIIDDGVTLYIQDGSQLVVSGPAAKITIDGAVMVETSRSDGALKNVGATVIVNGTLEADNDSTVEAHSILTSQTAEIIVNGTLI